MTNFERLIATVLIEQHKLLQEILKLEKCTMAQIDDLIAAVTKDANDTQALISGVAAEVSALNASIVALQAQVAAGAAPDLTAVIASVNAIDTLVTNATPPVAPVVAGVTTAPGSTT